MVMQFHWKSALGQVAAIILAATFCTSANGQGSAQSSTSPLPPFDGSKYGHGTCLVALEIDFETGRVTSAQMLFSTGDKKLDASALESVRGWLFKPHTYTRLKVPIGFAHR